MTETTHEFGGLHHLALVCRDMDRSVDFYSWFRDAPEAHEG
jgi:catechol 2,3-dioxygenase-like lactoylglutathione lyase family enzyme